MGMDLKPKKKDTDCAYFNCFVWYAMLNETGAGFVLGYGKMPDDPFRYVYSNGNHGSPVSNDGYIVSASEAKAMAMCCRGWLSVQRFLLKEKENSFIERNIIYQKDDFKETSLMQSAERFAEFAEKSGGFRIW